MQKLFLIIIGTILFFCLSSVNGQTKNKNSKKGMVPFLYENHLLNLKFEANIQSNIQFEFFLRKFSNFNQSAFLDNSKIPLPIEMLPAFYKEKNNLSNALQLERKWLNENKLGLFGQILGYANFAAAGYLLYTHLKKYKEDYK